MSHTTIKALTPGQHPSDFKTLRNGNGTAPPIWDYLCRTYLGAEYFWIHRRADELWALADDDRVPPSMRAVLRMTFDRSYVWRADYSRAAADIREFLRLVPPSPEYVNHWPTIAEIFESDPDIPAIGIHCTSASGEDPYGGEYDEDTDEVALPDWSTYLNVYEDADA